MNKLVRKYHKDGTLPDSTANVCFVFGSNRAGVHGKGAARIAHELFGATWRCGFGHMGASYAIPTKSTRLKTLRIDEIAPLVEDFVNFAHNNPDTQFFVTRVGCGLAGIPDEVMAPLFKEAPQNCSFAEQWKPYVE